MADILNAIKPDFLKVRFIHIEQDIGIENYSFFIIHDGQYSFANRDT